MSGTKSLIHALLAVSLTLGPAAGALAQSGHDHGAAAGMVVEMTLDNGQKWQTDDPLRSGMNTIRARLAESLPSIHDGRLTPVEYAMLADSLEKEVDNIVANCKLPEEADAQLHIAVAQLLEGAETMRGGSGQEEGALKAIEAINAYGEHFDHPGWQPLSH